MMPQSMPCIWCLWENNHCLAFVPNLAIFQRPAPVPWRTVGFPGFVTATAPHTYVWCFNGLPWPRGRPICIKSSVFLWQISTTRLAMKGGAKGTKGFFGKNGPTSPHHEEQKSEINMFRPLAPISHKFKGGIPTFSTSLFLLAIFGNILLWNLLHKFEKTKKTLI